MLPFLPCEPSLLTLFAFTNSKQKTQDEKRRKEKGINKVPDKVLILFSYYLNVYNNPEN